MTRYSINVSHGDKNVTTRFSFVHKDCYNTPQSKQDEAFNDAVQELNRIYKKYGRFATRVGVVRLFNSFGFEESYP